jgi:hypothetical protein
MTDIGANRVRRTPYSARSICDRSEPRRARADPGFRRAHRSRARAWAHRVWLEVGDLDGETLERDQEMQVYDRALMLGPKRNDVLALPEVIQYGKDSFGDPDYVSIYGLEPPDWHARGVRLLGRTAVECTRDRLGDLMGADIAELARASGSVAPVVVDPFAGSANTLYWIRRHLPISRGVGFELDGAVFEATQRNLSILGRDVELRHMDYEAGLKALAVPEGELLIVFVAPPWGDALTEASGLDLSRTTPRVTAIVDLVAATFPYHRLLLAIQIYERVDHTSFADLTARFDWSGVKLYDIDPPGRNHGLALATIRWMPATSASSGQATVKRRGRSRTWFAQLSTAFRHSQHLCTGPMRKTATKTHSRSGDFRPLSQSRSRQRSQRPAGPRPGWMARKPANRARVLPMLL